MIWGQGTLMLDFLDKHPNLKKIYIPVGGGGLISGCAIVAKNLKRNIKIIGVETENFPSLYNSFYKTKKSFEKRSKIKRIVGREIEKYNERIGKIARGNG